MKKNSKKIWDNIMTLIVLFFLVIAFALGGVKIIGLDVYTVLSGSMEPKYKTGSLIYVKNVDYKKLQAGDVITYMLDEDTVATHRIVEVVPNEENPNELRFKTKGDANNTIDGGMVHFKNIIGSPIFTIPKLGYFAHYIQGAKGRYLIISFAAVLILLFFTPEILGSADEKQGPKSQEER